MTAKTVITDPIELSPKPQKKPGKKSNLIGFLAKAIPLIIILIVLFLFIYSYLEYRKEAKK